MLKRYTAALAATALAWFTGSVAAQQPAPGTVYTPTPGGAVHTPGAVYAPGAVPGPVATAPGGCGGCLSTACCDNGGGGGFYGSIGVLFLKATSDTNPALSRFDRTVDVDTGVTLSRFTTMTNFDNGRELAPRLELGWSRGDGSGFRGRFFHYHTSDQINTVDAVDAPFGSTGVVNLSGVFSSSPLGVGFTSVGSDLDPTALTFENRIRLQTIDLETYWSSKCGCTELTWSLGVRYLQVSQEYNAFENLITIPPTPDFSPASPFNQSLRSGHNLNGLGPILGIEGRRPITDSLRLRAMGRVGLIYTEGGQDAFYLANFDPQFLIDPIFVERHAERNRFVTTAEVEVGTEYTRDLGRGELFVRGGLVGQCYFGVGNSSRFVLGGDANEPKNNNLTLFGVQLTVGLRY